MSVLFAYQDMLTSNKQLYSRLTSKKIAESGAYELLNSMLHMIDEAAHFVHLEGPKSQSENIKLSK
ncbi:hypothetical protein [Fodinibius salinus]|uniref:hypothetical protein n=1 Tax=Fodinibius salinus TaxID=860790 RepID=UPI0011E7827B|nr:hypothetical protein [Fodinibius salinus]